MKKTISLLLCLVLFFALPVGTLAMPDNSYEVTPNEYAQYFIDSVKPAEGYTAAGEPIRIYDEDENLCGFSVDLKKGAIPYGYVVIKFTEDGPTVSEFVTEKNVQNIYNQITGKNKMKTKSQEDKKIYSYGPNEYIVPLKSESETVYEEYGGTGQKIKENERKEIKKSAKQARKEEKEKFKKKKGKNKKEITYDATPAPSDGSNIILRKDQYSALKTANGWQITATGYLLSAFDIGFDLYGLDNTLAITGRYACGVVAMLNVMSYYKACGYSGVLTNVKSPFDRLWTLSGTTQTGNMDGTGEPLGSTSTSKYKPAMENYLSEKGYRAVVDNYSFTYYSDFKRDIDAERPCMFGYNYGAGKGHAVFVCGYIETTGVDFLEVGDGWNFEEGYIDENDEWQPTPKIRYLNFNGYTFVSKSGRCVQGIAKK